MGNLKQTLAKILNSRDELSPRNFRGDRWAIFLVFPLAVIIGDMRYFDLGIAKWGYESYELMLYPLGIGWLVLSFVPKRLIIPLLKCTAILSVLLLPFQFLITGDTGRLAVFMAFQLVNGICAACAFFLFCFELNNVERLYGMAIIQFYYGFYYTVSKWWRGFVPTVGGTFVIAVFIAFFFVTVFLCGRQRKDGLPDTSKDGKGSGAQFVIGLDVVYYIIMCMINYIEWADNGVLSMPFGIGSFISIALIFIIQIFFNRSAIYIWLMFLVFSLLGLGIIIYDSNAAHITGSVIYGAGDGLGYIIIYYLCAGAIKRSKSLKMFKLYCFVFFIEYVLISGIFSKAFDAFEGPSHYLALGVVLVLCSVCFLLIPLMQKKLFEADWTDGFYLADMPEYTRPLAETEAIEIKEHLNLTSREQEVFTMLLAGKEPREIAATLQISYSGVNFHVKNLFGKLGIQSRAELLVKYRK
jgi:DNA-binding CsgD family transcriptional regulator